jgi:hypothetical protein
MEPSVRNADIRPPFCLPRRSGHFVTRIKLLRAEDLGMLGLCRGRPCELDYGLDRARQASGQRNLTCLPENIIDRYHNRSWSMRDSAQWRSDAMEQTGASISIAAGDSGILLHHNLANIRQETCRLLALRHCLSSRQPPFNYPIKGDS